MTTSESTTPPCGRACQPSGRRQIIAGLTATAAAVTMTGVAGCTTTPHPVPTLRAGDSPAPALTITQLSQVPHHGAVIVPDAGVVVARDGHDHVWAFSMVCTHQGCAVSDVAQETINCGCHGSAFDIRSGKPVRGPATKPLTPVAVKVDGDNVVTA